MRWRRWTSIYVSLTLTLLFLRIFCSTLTVRRTWGWWTCSLKRWRQLSIQSATTWRLLLIKSRFSAPRTELSRFWCKLRMETWLRRSVSLVSSSLSTLVHWLATSSTLSCLTTHLSLKLGFKKLKNSFWLCLEPLSIIN